MNNIKEIVDAKQDKKGKEKKVVINLTRLKDLLAAMLLL
jgi:hypothetical protein